MRCFLILQNTTVSELEISTLPSIFKVGVLGSGARIISSFIFSQSPTVLQNQTGAQQ